MTTPSAKVRRNRARKAIAKLKPVADRLWGKPKKKVKSAIDSLRVERKKANEELAQARSGPRQALDWAVLHIGKTEQPPGSNRGPFVDTLLRACLGYLPPAGAAWCGCFVYVAASGVTAGVAGITDPARWAYVPFIIDDAKRRRNGLLPADIPRPGDLACFDFDGGVADHVGLVESVTSTHVVCIEGNTSSSDKGDQSNGGGVFRRERPRSQVQFFARPNYK